MAKISNQEAYPEDKQVALEDYLIGTDSQDRKRTKTYPLSSVVEVIQDAIEENLEMPKNTSDLVNDGNGTEAGPFATIEDARGKTYQFSNLKEVIVVHGKGVIVDVVVVVGVQQVFTSVEHSPDLNNVTVRFSKQETGFILIK
ncbi:hypothetical protein [Flavobacterium sp. HSC-61S13]|uniref:hypothetical protein n=1 Tax=Flavobacterium sp. HSC-61S13 TaxID=2910963 RepID=UPI0020A0389D|nr:hypothetical protein [Flavobacterium sp. HSC-61S13]MCP1996669.1 hypothetical protein [Flavobacterium sp. HSC-61S13]